MKILGSRGWILIVLALALIDQASKAIVSAWLPLYQSKSVIPGFFNLYHTTNRGAVWGLFSKSQAAVPLIMLILSSCAFLIILVLFWRGRYRGLERVSFLLILGGALGNIIDRLRYGQVIDFLDFHLGRHHWPTFNLADSFIFCGVVLLAWTILRGNKCTQS